MDGLGAVVVSEAIEKIAEALNHRGLAGAADCCEALSVEFRSEVREHRRDCIDAAGGVGIADQIERRQFDTETCIIPLSILCASVPAAIAPIAARQLRL